MSKFTDVLVSLQREGHEFSIFVKEKGALSTNGTVKFSYAYVTSEAEQLLPVDVWDLVDGESVIKCDTLQATEEFGCAIVSLSLDKRTSIEKYLCSAFKLLRQVPCKTIAKVWIKAIEPRKKTRFPYIRGEMTKPSWWPREVQHREPDHLQKNDRLRLMSSIITEVLPRLGNNEILEELCQSTLALSLFKNDPEKNLIIRSIFEISKGLCRRKEAEHLTINVIDLAFAQKRHQQTHLRRIDEILGQNRILEQGLLDELGYSEPSCECDLVNVTDHNGSISSTSLVDMLVANDPSLGSVLDTLDNDES